MRTSTSRRRPTSRTGFDMALRDQRKHREHPKRSPEEHAAWCQRQVQEALARINKHRDR